MSRAGDHGDHGGGDGGDGRETEATASPFAVAFLIAHPWGCCAGVTLPRVRGKTATLATLAPTIPEAALAALAAGERAHAQTLSPGRMISWVGGRLALRAALRARPDADRAAADIRGPILSDDRGAPQLPAGVVGSISHKDGLAVALAATADGDGWRVGVDLEDRRPARQDIATHVLSDGERAAIAGLDEPARQIEVLVRFAVKEAVYKALDPTLRRHVGFREVTVARDARGLHAAFAPRPGEPGFVVEIDAIATPFAERILIAARARTAH